MKRRLLLIIIILAIAIIIAPFAPKKIELMGEIKTEYVYGEKFEAPSVYSTSILAFLNSRSLPVGKAKVAGFNGKRIGKQTITISYMWTKVSYNIEVYARILSQPQLELDGQGVLHVGVSDEDIAYLDSFDVEVDGQKVSESLATTNIKEGIASYDIAAFMRTGNKPDQTNCTIIVVSKGSAANQGVKQSPAATHIFDYHNMSYSDFGDINAIFHSYSVSKEYDKIVLSWHSLPKIEDCKYNMHLSFYSDDILLDTQERQAPNQPIGSSGVIALKRWGENGTTVLANKVIFYLTVVGNSNTIYNITQQQAQQISCYVAEVKQGTTILDDDYVVSVVKVGGAQ